MATPANSPTASPRSAADGCSTRRRASDAVGAWVGENASVRNPGWWRRLAVAAFLALVAPALSGCSGTAEAPPGGGAPALTGGPVGDTAGVSGAPGVSG